MHDSKKRTLRCGAAKMEYVILAVMIAGSIVAATQMFGDTVVEQFSVMSLASAGQTQSAAFVYNASEADSETGSHWDFGDGSDSSGGDTSNGGEQPAAGGATDSGGNQTGPVTPDDFTGDRTAHEVFEEDYMRSYIGQDIPGAGDARLNALMAEMMTSDHVDPAVLDEIAAIRGVDPAEFREQFEVFQQLRQQEGVLLLDLEQHPDYLGSLSSLRYGSVVGDVIGIDPVLAALLNPSGGIVGPGNTQLLPDDPDNATVYHGVFHDAAGFMYNTYELGPRL